MKKVTHKIKLLNNYFLIPVREVSAADETIPYSPQMSWLSPIIRPKRQSWRSSTSTIWGKTSDSPHCSLSYYALWREHEVPSTSTVHLRSSVLPPMTGDRVLLAAWLAASTELQHRKWKLIALIDHTVIVYIPEKEPLKHTNMPQKKHW